MEKGLNLRYMFYMMKKIIVFKSLEIGHREMIMIVQVQVQGRRRIRFNGMWVHRWKRMYAGQKSRGKR
jgi:hypothetical protein